jgi:UDP-N-acetylglucosamine 2-epimerase (non-hydrolysing)
MLKVLSVFGTRPETIKMAPVVSLLQATDGIESRVCVTGQHRSMLDGMLATFSIRPEYDLNLMRHDQGLSELFGRIMVGLDLVLSDWQPDCILVQGDTASSTAAAMAGFFRRIAVGHIEAGLRTGNTGSPWPEEANRRMTAVVSTRHYAPTQRARAALLAEGHDAAAVLVTGNTVIDSLQHMTRRLSEAGPLRDAMRERYGWLDPERRLVLVTGHRRESFGDGFEKICEALAAIAAEPGVQVVYPVHLNPNVRGPVFERLADVPSIALIEPLDYPDFVYLMGQSDLILTDSGGVQEEAPFLRKPVLVMRDDSERIEAIEAGVARLVGTDPATIHGEVMRLLSDPAAYVAMASGASPFGDGFASARIVADLLTRSDRLSAREARRAAPPASRPELAVHHAS